MDADPALEAALGALDVLLVRHGSFTRTADAQGRIDEVADPDALTQARELASRLAASGRELTLLSSPQQRAVATARILAERLDLPLYVDPDLAEIRIARHPDLDEGATGALWAEVRARPQRAVLPGAETQAAAAARVHAALRSAVRAAEGRLVVAMTHGGLIEALLQHLEQRAGRTPQARTLESLALHGLVVGAETAVVELAGA
ncbi:MAG TPA: histidine phosphatase family protein [Pseudomonadales bacterium]|nr:histidine phosphatase family protein [Pseudomonadales bacterium]